MVTGYGGRARCDACMPVASGPARQGGANRGGRLTGRGDRARALTHACRPRGPSDADAPTRFGHRPAWSPPTAISVPAYALPSVTGIAGGLAYAAMIGLLTDR
ncbi:hypothetical protein HNP84_008771 [Thermocatellispora tengchongensis]|uniref:Uncharacterized protein n=1 Tax=Thermocatellispora tengchongensis TaxID=1073253 RepID=A0A840PJ67_9ACTN|nr:hypothetical protein [Thermocatellispora tengchongensis]